MMQKKKIHYAGEKNKTNYFCVPIRGKRKCVLASNEYVSTYHSALTLILRIWAPSNPSLSF